MPSASRLAKRLAVRNSKTKGTKRMRISQNCLEIIKKWEGFRPESYLDPVGIPTIGYGTTRYPDGRRVRLGERISEAQAEAYLKFGTDATVGSLNAMLKGIDLNQNQFDALVSLCYNIGAGGFRESTVLKRLREGRFGVAAAAFGLWNKGTVNGVKKVLPGLTRRRADERALFERVGGEGSPMAVEPSPQDRVTRIEGYRDGGSNVIAAFAGETIIEILEFGITAVGDLIETVRQYKNASVFEFAPAGRKIPAGPRIAVTGRSVEIGPGAGVSVLSRSPLAEGMSDNAPEGEIRRLQGRLKELGYYRADVDGEFGKRTDDAVREFQLAVLGAAETDGKVGPKTWDAIWRGIAGSSDAARPETSAVKAHFLRLTKTMTKDPAGCYRLKLDYFRSGSLTDSMFVNSGQPRRQFFRTGPDSVRGSYEPLPEGRWRIRDIIWAGARDVYDKRVHKEGIGPAKIPLDFDPKSGTRRDAIQIHIDWNRANAPGTAGCVGVYSVADFRRLVGWLRESDPKHLYVDWGLGSVEMP
jgi:lysozyme